MKTLSKNTLRIVVSFLLVSFFGIFIIGSSSVLAENEIITLSDAGWSDPGVGIWDPATRTGTLMQDISGSIIIESGDITLDGNGYSLTGDGTGNGVYAEGKFELTIQNLTVRNFNNGILLSFSNLNTISGNTFEDNANSGIYLYEATYNTVSGNRISGSGYCGLQLKELAYNNTISENTIINNYMGIGLFGASHNEIVLNTVQNNGTGLFLSNTPYIYTNIPSRANLIYQNNFIDNSTHAYNFDYSANEDNRFFLNYPEGGNYWSGHTAPDADLDGIVDLPYAFNNGEDNLPWAVPNGWELIPETPEPIPSYLYVYINDDGWSEPVGTWDAENRIAALTQDINGSIIIAANDITLDGAGHTLHGNGIGKGLQMISHERNTISNLNLSDYDYGIYLYYSYENTIENCTVSASEYGIYLSDSPRNSLLENNAVSNSFGLVLYHYADENTVTGNQADTNGCGVAIYGSFDNVVTQNTVQNSAETGIMLQRLPLRPPTIFIIPNRNQIYNNDFINNTIQASVNPLDADNTFCLEPPVGGNYWDDHVSTDTDADGFADTAYVFSGGQDDYPLMEPFGWHSEPEEPEPDDLVAEAEEIVGELDIAIESGTISGNGSSGKLSAFRNKLVEVRSKLEAGDLRSAYQLLKTVYAFADGEPSPKDQITGPGVPELAEMISQLLLQLDPSAQ